MIYGNEYFNEGLIYNKSNPANKIDLTDIKDKDLKNPTYVKKLLYRIKNEEDKKLQKDAIMYLLSSAAFIGLTAVIPIYGLAFIINNIIYIVDNLSGMSSTEYGRLIKAMKKRRDKTTDKKDIEKLDKLIDKMEDIDAEVTSTKPNVNVSNYNYNW